MEYGNFGLTHLYDQLRSVDAKSALWIKAHDRYRIMRALGNYRITKRPPSELRQSFLQGECRVSAHCLYKKPDKEALLKKIFERVRGMYEKGLIEEALGLQKRLPAGHWALDVMGYREALDAAVKKNYYK